MTSKSLCARHDRELAQMLDEFREKGGFQPTLSIVFCSIDQNLAAIQQVFSQRGIDLIGCTTSGEIRDDACYEQHIVGLLFDLDPKYYRIYLAADPEANTFMHALVTGQFALRTFSNPALITLSGGFTVNADEIIQGFNTVFKGRTIPIFGGQAGDGLHLKETYVFSTSAISNRGLINLVLDEDKIEMSGLATSGWEPIGAIHTITKAEGNMVYAIDEEPALDFFIKHFGYFNSAEIQVQSLENMSTQYPLQLFRPDGYTVLRSPIIGSEETRSLMLAGGVNEGDRFRFSMSPGFEVIDQTIENFREVFQSSPEADALILFSCKGRHSALGPLIGDEVKGIYNHWKTPMVGFFSYGELGPNNEGFFDFHNETCSLVLLREKNDYNTAIPSHHE